MEPDGLFQVGMQALGNRALPGRQLKELSFLLGVVIVEIGRASCRERVY
jgi:hypothetical protein